MDQTARSKLCLAQVGRVESIRTITLDRMENEDVEESMRCWETMFPKMTPEESGAVSPGSVGPWPIPQQAPIGSL